MSKFKFEVPNFLKPHIPEHTDATRRGSERCPYCGGYHSRDSEFRACADNHSYANATYRCPRCGAIHSSLGAANACCETEKRFDRQYDSTTYNNYMGGASEDSEPSWYEQIRNSGRDDSDDDGGGMFSSFFNAGGQKTSSSSSDDGGGIFSSFFDAGGSKDKDKGKGSSQGHWFFG